MQWWKGKLYVGTNRAYGCVSQWELQKVTNPTLFPYPPLDPDMECTPDPADLPLPAEIWRWTPETDTWEMVYRSPNDVDNPDHPGKKIPRDIGFRTMAAHVDRDGTEALYVGGVTGFSMWDGPVPPPRILRTTDGVSWEAIPQMPGTLMGDLPKDSMRTLTSFGGRLFVIHGTIQGAGVVLAADDPAAGNDAWQVVLPQETPVFEMHAFNGSLYLGTLDLSAGYSILKTDTSGLPPFSLTTVIPPGAYSTSTPSDYVLSMHVFDDRLFIGTGSFFTPARPTEIVRINRDDTWNLVMGESRITPEGWKFPISGLREGFGNGFNDHIWRMQGHDGVLYIGTFDGSNQWALAGVAEDTAALRGFDLYRTSDGWYINAIATDGFGDNYSDGIRNFADTPFGLFFGTKNEHFGLRIWRRQQPVTPVVPAPERTEVEMRTAGPVLSWKPVSSAVRYRVSRARIKKILLYPNLLGGPSIPEGFELRAVTRTNYFVDRPLATGDQFLYKVVAEDADANLSASSNLVHVPLPMPPVTFEVLSYVIDRLETRDRFVSAEAVTMTRALIQSALTQVVAGNLSQAASELEGLRQQALNGSLVKAPDHLDMEIVTDKFKRRVSLAQLGLVPLILLIK